MSDQLEPYEQDMAWLAMQRPGVSIEDQEAFAERVSLIVQDYPKPIAPDKLKEARGLALTGR